MGELEARIRELDPAALCATGVEVLQVNVGLRCNMACPHCHQASSPRRAEIMPRAVLDEVVDAARRLQPVVVDLTGGAPELHPDIRYLVRELRREGLQVQLRTNLTVLLEPSCQDLPELWAEQGVVLLASLPSWDPAVTDRLRGAGVLADSVRVLRRLNALGYGRSEDLRLDLVTHPDGPRLPGDTAELEARFRHELDRRHGVAFSSLRLIANMPIGRFDRQLSAARERDAYLDQLRAAFNPATVPHLACRTSLLVAWDGGLYDCDFNLAAGIPVADAPRTVAELDPRVARRRIAFGMHCFACTAQAGSS